MKKSYLLPLLILISATFNMYGQQEKNIENEYAAYFTLPREALYLHVNKTSYFAGEEIWFKGYTYDQKNQLSSKATTNINIGIYDAEGNQFKKALFRAENGLTKGNFIIDSTFTPGTYYIKAETNWMKNFKENNAFIQKIEIITQEETKKKNSIKDKQYDFQFLPEGGHIVANTLSNVGFKIIDTNGKGVSVSGVIHNEEKKQIASFQSNAFGMGKFLFQPKTGQKYTASITLADGTILSKTLPKAKETGISMILNSPFADKIILNFSTNEKTSTSNPIQQYKVLIHQNGNLKTIDLKLDKIQKGISVPKKDLFKGVNTITVFNNNGNPVLERLFFNDYFTKRTNINVSKLNTINDSILLSIKELNLKENANISISILPEGTKGYNPQNNIISNFYLKPHVKGFIENAPYYFYNMDKKKKYELDVLLLTQGWSRYDWNDIFNEKPNGLNRFENGITVKGKVNKPVSNIDRIFLYATKNHSATFIDLNENQEFTIENFFLEEGEEVRFSYINKKGIFKKPSMYLRFLVTDKKDKISKVFLNERKSVSPSINFTVPKDFFYEKSEELDTVTLEGENSRLAYKDPFMADPVVTDITEEDYYNYYNVVQFLHLKGFNATQEQGAVSIIHRLAKRGKPAVFFNNTRIRDPELRILYNLSLANVERIVYDIHSVIPIDGGSSNGVIKIYTREIPLFSIQPVYLSTKTTAAFITGKKYYAPNYTSYLNPLFKQYGTISWIPMLALNTETPASFKIYDTYTKNITLFIEGISENGNLISEKKTIQVR